MMPMTNSLADIVVKATPGEWFLAEDLEPEGGCLSRGLMAPDSFVAHVLFDDEDDTQAAANAELLVRAKSLATLVLEAREALREGVLLAETDVEQREFELSEDVEDFDADHILQIYRDRADRFRATLAKLESL